MDRPSDFDTLIARGVKDADRWQARRFRRLLRRGPLAVLAVLLAAGLACGAAWHARQAQDRRLQVARCETRAALLAERTRDYQGGRTLPETRVDCAADPEQGLRTLDRAFARLERAGNQARPSPSD